MTTTSTSAPTQRQIARLYTLAGQAGLGHDEVIGQLRAAYGIETTKRLTLLQYEEFCLWIQGRIGARRIGDGKAPAREGQLWRRAQVANLLDQEWIGPPPLAADLRDRLIDVLDDFRLYRSTGRIGTSILRATIQQIGRHRIEIVAEACEIWLGHYRERNEQYFAGILRRLKRENKGKAKDDKRAAAMDEHRHATELEHYGWKPVGRLPDGRRVFHSDRTGRHCVMRGDETAGLTREEIKAIIRGPDQ